MQYHLRVNNLGMLIGSRKKSCLFSLPLSSLRILGIFFRFCQFDDVEVEYDDVNFVSSYLDVFFLSVDSVGKRRNHVNPKMH